MVYTEIKERNNKKSYYRVLSVRNGKKVSKKRIYLGSSLSLSDLSAKEKEADEQLDNLLRIKKKEVIEKITSKIVKILRRHGIKRASLFGSYARGEQKKNSDIDLIIEPKKGMGLEFVDVGLELEDEIGRKVDLLTYNSIHPLIKRYLKRDEVKIL